MVEVVGAALQNAAVAGAWAVLQTGVAAGAALQAGVVAAVLVCRGNDTTSCFVHKT